MRLLDFCPRLEFDDKHVNPDLADATLTAVYDYRLPSDECSIVVLKNRTAPVISSGSRSRLMACCSHVERFCSSD